MIRARVAPTTPAAARPVPGLACASLFAALVLLLAVAFAARADAAVALRFSPADTTIMLGAGAHLSVMLDEPLEVRTVEVWVQYDPAILTSVAGVKGALFDAVPCFIWEGFEATAPNAFHGYAIAMGSTCWVTGPGELFRWSFQGTARGVSPIVSAEARLYDPRANLIADVTLGPTTVRVKDPAVTPVPSATPGGPSIGISPNPFNPRTSVALAVSVAGPARVDAFDLRGRGVGTVWAGWATPGMAPVTWDARGANGCPLPSGLYVVRLRDAAGRIAATRAMLAR
jgi:hypothetical protein